MKLGPSLLWISMLATCLAQPPRAPNVEAQRAAMKKLDFLVGTWCGEVRVHRGPGEPLELAQTEEVQYKLDGLVLLIEGTGRSTSDGKPVFRALATVSYDDAAGQYRMRAYNDGRYMETELKLPERGKGFAWGLAFGPAQMSYVMALNDKGEWTETGDMTMPGQPPSRVVELTVRRQKQ
jgi:hypothetical protein